MKTEFLKGLGLEQDAIDKIMAENGKDIAAEQAKTEKAKSERDNYKTQLDTAKESLAKFDGVNVDEMKEQITKLQADLKAKDDEYSAKEAARAFNDNIVEAIKAAGGRNPKAIMSLLDIDALKASKDQSADIKNAIETVKKSDAYMFGSDEPHKNAVNQTGGNGGNGENGSLAAIRAAMGLPAKND